MDLPRPEISTSNGLPDGEGRRVQDDEYHAVGDTRNNAGTAGRTTTSKLKVLKNKVRAKARDTLRQEVGPGSEDDDLKQSLQQDPAFNPDILLEQQGCKAATSPKKVLDVVQKVSYNIVHPKKALTSKVTRTTADKLSRPYRPFLSQGADVEFLQAHEELEEAGSRRTSCRTSSDHDHADPEYQHRKHRMERLKANRESLRIAWTTSRHVLRVRVTPKRQWPYPERSAFVEKDERGRPSRCDWLSWIGQLVVWYTQDFSAQYIEPSGPLPFNADTLRHHAERVAVASAPWQSWLMSVRSVFRWEEPRVTGKWLALFLFLWHTNLIMSFLYAYIIYAVLRNRFYPTSVKSLESAQRRAQDNSRKAVQISELMDKHGNEGWLEPLAKDVGPYVQLQVNDIANLLEVLEHFYHWAAPRQTVATLIFFFACLLVGLFADMAFCMKIFWFIVGGTFFLCWPISSLYPHYRMLVSPVKWVFWGIPNNAEWSFMYLRREAQERRSELIERKVERKFQNDLGSVTLDPHAERVAPNPILVGEVQDHRPLTSHEDDPSSDDEGYETADSARSVCDGETLFTFRCTCNGVPGHFGITSSSLRFMPWLKQGDSWTRPFVSLVEMRKHDGSSLKRMLGPKSIAVLELTFTDGASVVLNAMRGRDKAFNTVIGFSGMEWQSLQPEG